MIVYIYIFINFFIKFLNIYYILLLFFLLNLFLVLLIHFHFLYLKYNNYIHLLRCVIYEINQYYNIFYLIIPFFLLLYLN